VQPATGIGLGEGAAAVGALPFALYTAGISDGFAGPRFLGDDIERISGFPAAAFEPAGFWTSRIHPADRDRVAVEAAALPEKDAFAIEYRWRCADGNFRSFLDRAAVARDPTGSPREAFGIWLRLADRRLFEEEEADHVRAMERVGRAAGGIAHDLNNMLAAVVGSLDLLMTSLKGDKVAAKRAERALQGALRCADFTQRLVEVARPQPLRPGQGERPVTPAAE
jgi:signal transduction histidine kinase